MDDTETRLRAEIEDLKRRLNQQQNTTARPSKGALWTIALLAAVFLVVAFFTGYIPHQRREAVLANEAMTSEKTAPTVNVVVVERSAGKSELVLPGSIQAVTEAPVLARSSGYVKRRYVDIGDRVSAGQILAELEAPELIQMLRQAQAALEQTKSAVEQASANLQQSRTNERLAQVTAQRWANLFTKGVVSRQENDTYQAQYDSQKANTQSLEKAVSAARSNVAAAEANVARLTELQGFSKVHAPFAGVITVRNVDTGVLVSEGNTLLFRIAQTNRLRTYLNLSQADASSVRVGQVASLTIPDLPGRKFAGTVTRTANALDPATRTLLTEVQVSNPDGALMPGMYVRGRIAQQQVSSAVLLPQQAVQRNTQNDSVMVVGADGKPAVRVVKLGGSEAGNWIVLDGLKPGEQVIADGFQKIRPGATVKPVPWSASAPATPAPAASAASR